MSALETTADQQAVWSATAGKLKRRADNARWWTFGLSILGALLATVASQLPEGRTRLTIAILGAVLLAVVSFLSLRLLTPSHLSAWARARAASEALKREAFKYATEAAPYDGVATRDTLLDAERGRIEEDVDDLLASVVRASGPGSAPRTLLTRQEYLERRVNQQIRYYDPASDKAQRTARTLRAVEFALALAATALTALVGVAGKKPFGIEFDFVALTAVLTTIGGAVLTHIEASRLDYLVVTYRATSRRLRDAKGALAGTNATALSPQDWSAFVQRCEAILAEENTNWLAKWSKA